MSLLTPVILYRLAWRGIGYRDYWGRWRERFGFFADPEACALRDSLRPAVFVPESKRLNVLLKEFRSTRNHMAIVVDEYSGIAGLVTIEDVIEQIVGDIEDEYDFDETESNIIPERQGRYRVKALTEITDFNEALGCELSDDEYDTIGGLVVSRFGHLPKRGESIQHAGLRFQVIRADSRRIHSLLVERLPDPLSLLPGGA